MFIRLLFYRFLIAALSLMAASVVTAQSLPEMRMTPQEIRASALDSNQVGSSGLPGVHTKVLAGDPLRAGFYTILLFAPLTPRSRPVRTATIGWLRSSRASGTWDTGLISMRSR